MLYHKTKVVTNCITYAIILHVTLNSTLHFVSKMLIITLIDTQRFVSFKEIHKYPNNSTRFCFDGKNKQVGNCTSSVPNDVRSYCKEVLKIVRYLCNGIQYSDTV